MQVRDVMNKDPYVINANRSLFDAARMMKDLGLGCLPVEENDRMIGMITDRDIVVKGIAEKSLDDGIRVRECMSPGITYCFEDEDLSAVCHKLADKCIRRIPVVNGSKRLVGMLSVDDIAPSSIDDETFHEMMCSIAMCESDGVCKTKEPAKDIEESEALTITWSEYDFPLTME